MKLYPTDIEAAFLRAVAGESVNSLARDFNVTEGALRWRFKRQRCDPLKVRRAAWHLFDAQLAYERLSERDRLTVDRLVLVLRGKPEAIPESYWGLSWQPQCLQTRASRRIISLQSGQRTCVSG